MNHKAQKKIKIDDDFINNNVFILDTDAHYVILYEDRDRSVPFFERYIYVGVSGERDSFYIDTYFVDYLDTLIDFAYDYDTMPKDVKMYELIKDYIKFQGIDLLRFDGRLHTRRYPKKKFIRMLERSFN